MKKRPYIISLLLAVLAPTSLLAASSSDQTNLYAENLSVNAYSLEVTFDAGNNGGDAGYGVFTSTAEMQKRVKTSFSLKENDTTLYTYLQEWNDPNSAYTSYWKTGMSTTISSTSFGNRALSYVQTGKTYEVIVCLDETNAIPESSESDNCTSATVTYGIDPDGDNDKDGLTNIEESYLGTNENDADTDDDTLTDAQEVDLLYSDPTLPDTDGDGILDPNEDNDSDNWSNFFEVNDNAPAGTLGNFTGEGGHPNSAFTDDDSLGDDFELTFTFCNQDVIDVTIDDGDHDGVTDDLEDCDQDGLNNEQEETYGTNPTLPDTDNDSSPDATEVAEGTDPLNAQSIPLDPNGDEDNDGLTNEQEESYGTDRENPDSDGDAYTDGEEVSYGTDPVSINSTPAAFVDTDGDRVRDSLDKDDDEDKIRDSIETTNGTNPRKADTDGDGIDDKNDAYPLDATK